MDNLPAVSEICALKEHKVVTRLQISYHALRARRDAPNLATGRCKLLNFGFNVRNLKRVEVLQELLNIFKLEPLQAIG